MKHLIILITHFFIGAVIIGCASSNNLFTQPSNQFPPAEEILINNEQFNRPHHVLGTVQYTLKSRSSLFTNQLELREQAIDLLKQQTYAKYGDEVDAIIDTRVEEKYLEDVDGKFNIINVQGIAISFLDGGMSQTKTTTKSKAKHKAKSPKKIIIVRKAKPKEIKKPVEKAVQKIVQKPTVKPKPVEIEITPTEILK